MPRFHPELDGTNRAFPGSAPAPAMGLPWAGGSTAGRSAASGQGGDVGAPARRGDDLLSRAPGNVVIRLRPCGKGEAHGCDICEPSCTSHQVSRL